MEIKHPRHQVNKALLESERIVLINRMMKKINQATDFLYESMVDHERAYTFSAIDKIQSYCEEIKNDFDKYLKKDGQ
ncbi:hypothetical protein elemo19C_phanotate4 [Flavobacterium phage vB_FspP_elemoA_1-9C]|jgi:hypothetical protein|uniref:Uncharacterized protein n=6 Tax=Elemovirus TaxID=2948694 RepID=A0A7D7JRW5_9CAUD|nr:hypothetical protein KNV10_gp03 [Flavobacterium phage vB_FspP_elemoA_7-9A]YP_010108910.1 hypothetical protein KNV11_gp03 [Flavobacterium phage vB_FspP_elemoF_6-3D]YP_010108998.1 hypothetical protein KNV12_gp03 [Flavobacterium phage vB_FspP_elemoE_6-9C]YP_010109156.1 hypothetical protein KNV13_gp75 [Flavobacterium phage vB_FspP_elemoD_13-5B]YP_010356079.1 hypothetical protein M1M19_gp03 [Flavobacterium phage vB_FspP_elemoB_14-3B]YP_010356441.1 hypothetical protein M1M21_gp03 [Flavobacterium 